MYLVSLLIPRLGVLGMDSMMRTIFLSLQSYKEQALLLWSNQLIYNVQSSSNELVCSNLGIEIDASKPLWEFLWNMNNFFFPPSLSVCVGVFKCKWVSMRRVSPKNDFSSLFHRKEMHTNLHWKKAHNCFVWNFAFCWCFLFIVLHSIVIIVTIKLLT